MEDFGFIPLLSSAEMFAWWFLLNVYLLLGMSILTLFKVVFQA